MDLHIENTAVPMFLILFYVPHCGKSKHVSIVLERIAMLTQSVAVTAVDGASFKHTLDLLADEGINV